MRRSTSLLLAGLLASSTFGAHAEGLDHAALVDLTHRVDRIARQAASDDASMGSIMPLLTERLQDIASATPFDTPAFARIDGKAGLHTIPVDFMLAQLRLQTGTRFNADISKALAEATSPALFIRGGTITLDELAAQAATQFPGAINRVGDTYVAHWPIVIWSDSGLLIDRNSRLELSTRSGAFILNTGLLQLDNGAISGSPETNAGLPDFRPFIVTAMSGALQVRQAEFSHLGFADSGSTSGISMIGAALLPAKIRSFFVDSSFRDVASVDLLNTHNVLIAGNRFRDATGPAIAMNGINGGRVISNIVTGSRHAQGIDIQNHSANIEVAHNVVVGNRGSGIFLANGVSDIEVSANLLSGNGRGGISIVRGACLELADNIVINNRQVGIKVRASNGLTLSRNQLIGNSGPGVSVIDQEPQAALNVSANRFIANKSGLHGGSASQVALTGNDFAGQSPVLLDGEFSSYVPQLLRIAAKGGDTANQPFVIHANEQSSPRIDCQSGS